MFDKSKKIALVLGGGDLVKSLIEECIFKKIDFKIIAIKEYYTEIKNIKPQYYIGYNKIGNIFKILNQNNIRSVMFLGNIKKIPLQRLRPNLITFYYIIVLLTYYNKGDAELLNRIIKIFSKKGFDILDTRVLLKKYLASDKENNLSKFTKIISKETIKYYFELAKNFGKEDVGQSIIVKNNRIILREDKEGTDKMIEKYKKIKSNFPAFLVKVSKPAQDLIIDLPTIGPNTIKKLIEVGLKGIIIEKNKTYIANIKQTLELIKENKLLFYAV